MMDNVKFLILLASLINLSVFCMYSEVIRYDDIPFATPEQVQNDLPALPADLSEEVETWKANNAGILEEFVGLPPTVGGYMQAVMFRNRFKSPNAVPHDVGQFNHIFHTKSAAIRIPGLQNALCEQVSAMGADPYNREQIAAIGGHVAALHANKPRQQGVSRLLAAYMLERLNSSTIKTPKVYAFHLSGKPNNLDDRNYVMIQRKIPANLLRLIDLSNVQKRQVFSTLPLKDLYNAMKYTALWQFKEDDVYVNPENIQEMWLVDLEKPNNEGYDPSAGRGQRGSSAHNVAVYGKDSGKWKFDVYENGFVQIKELINKYAPERVNEWNQLKAQDSDA